MGLADLFRPKYRHSNVSIRSEAVRALSSEDLAILTQVAKTDRDITVRRIAVEKIDEADVLADIAAAETERSLREFAGERAAELWAKHACGDDAEAASTALGGIIKLGDQQILVSIAIEAHLPASRKRAFAELRDPRALAELAKSDAPQDLRAAAVARIDDGDVLRALAIDTGHKEVGLAAVDKLDDIDRLENVAQKAKNKAVRQRARKIVTEMAEAERAAKPAVPDDVKRRRAERAQLLREIEAHADSFDFAKTSEAVATAEAAWAAIAHDVEDEADGRFKKALGAVLQAPRAARTADAHHRGVARGRARSEHREGEGGGRARGGGGEGGGREGARAAHAGERARAGRKRRPRARSRRKKSARGARRRKPSARPGAKKTRSARSRSPRA